MSHLKFEKKLLIPTVLLALFVLSFIHPLLYQFDITHFPGLEMGNALLNGIDITKKIQYFYLFLFLLLPIIVFLINLLLQKLLNSISKQLMHYICTLSCLGILNFILFFIAYIKDKNTIMPISLTLLLLLNLILILFALFTKKFKDLKLEHLEWAMMAAVPIPFISTLILHRLPITILASNTLWLITYGIGGGLLFLLAHKSKKSFERLTKAFLWFLCAPLLESLFLEFYNILNQHSIFLNHKTIIIFSIYLCMGIVSFLSYFKNRNKSIQFDYKKYYYPMIIIILGLITAAISLTTTVNTDFFESSNHGMGVYELFRYQKIPLIETFDAHMLNNQFFGILYGLFNQDVYGSIFCLYSSYQTIFCYLIIYLFLKKIFSNDIAFLTILFFPLLFDTGLIYFSFGLLAIFVLLFAIQKKSFLAFLSYWMSLAFLCIWKLDIGFSASIASVLILVYYGFRNRKDFPLKRIFLSLFTVLFAFLSFYLTICLIKNISPISRAIEFLSLSMSNVNWAYAYLGDSATMAYVVGYYCMPVIMLSSFLYIFCISHRESSQYSLLFLFLALFYILNFQRGLVRHSLVESYGFTFIFSFALFYLALFLSRYVFKNNHSFWISYIILLLLNQLLLTPNSADYTNFIDTSIQKYNTFTIHDEVSNEKVNRVVLSDEMRKEFSGLQTTLDLLLNENETFLDFTNQTLLYAFLDREKPVYVNQSPGLLSNEISQQLFLDEIARSSKDVSIVLKAKEKLLSSSMDGIVNEYRYYLISEYIYQHYVPVTIIDQYEIWVKKEKLKDSIEILENANIETISIQDYLEYNFTLFQLGYIPYVWGLEFSNSSTNIHNQISSIDLKSHQEYKVKVDLQKKDILPSNYLHVQITSSKDANLFIRLMDKEQMVGEFLFRIQEGTHHYSIRVSTIYAWYVSEIDHIILEADDSFTLDHLYFSK